MKNIKKLSEWGLDYSKKPFLISGPCSAETQDQVIATAKELKNLGVKIFRTGIWKPRTRPNCFEGVGSIGLKWLKMVQTETSMLTAIEVANSKHVHEAINAGVDILWIGARTTANPFAVQEIADALKGIDIPVFVKNPINPDLELWLGAIERLHTAGLRRIGAIHRGFSVYEHSIYRNAPQWQIPIDLKNRFPNIPIICDPSHIGGKRDLIKNLSQKSVDLDFDGLMIESHVDPDNAWSDSQQQITPISLINIIDNLIIRKVKQKAIPIDRLNNLRDKIDFFDNELMETLKKRVDVVKEIAGYKKNNSITILQPDRWRVIINKSLENAAKYDLSNEFVSQLFKIIHQESINKQTEIMNEETNL